MPGIRNWTAALDTVRRQHDFRHPSDGESLYPALTDAISPHIQSFNALLDGNRLLEAGLRDIGEKVCLDRHTAVEDERPQPFQATESKWTRNKLIIRARDIFLDRAVLPVTNKFSTKNRDIYPAECRERHVTYRGRLRCKLEYQLNDGEWHSSVRELGQLPIMLRSNRCHLQKLTSSHLVLAKEESGELGGYFIVNGVEKLIRMLLLPRRNYPVAIIRSSFIKRGPAYTKFGIQIRCVRPDQSSQTNVLHYLSDGNMTLRFAWRKNEYLVPVVMILKALIETNDREIYESLVGSATPQSSQDTFTSERVELLLRTYKAYDLQGRSNTRAYLGEKFRQVLGLPELMTDREAGTEFLKRIVLVHLGNVDITEPQDLDKYRLLIFMIHKLYCLASGDCAADNPDAVSNQEILLPGFLYGMIIKEKLDEWLTSIQAAVQEWTASDMSASFRDPDFIKEFSTKILRKVNENVCGNVEYFLSTGNLGSPSGLDLQQASGFTVVVEKINFYRFISHFRMVHRGSFFAQLKTTTVRKLLPESWGFLCPVHTPDGAPCGLLNHLAHACRITTQCAPTESLRFLLAQYGLGANPSATTEKSIAVQLDGRVLGYCSPVRAQMIASAVRESKVNYKQGFPLELEIGYIPPEEGGLFPGLFFFSHAARMIRPVKHVLTDNIDYVGSFEQPYMSIACMNEDSSADDWMHKEITPTNILSLIANQTPFSDFNQSPRNMYQCQMSKQAMGTPGTALRYRSDNKMYLLQTGQTPVVRPPLYNEYGLDHYPNGMNAVVAVISYTGYDMDDAMIISKSAHERGFGHGTIYKTKVIRLHDEKTSRSLRNIQRLFGFAPNAFVPASAKRLLDEDGLPCIGSMIQHGDPLCASHTVDYDPSHRLAVNSPYVNNDRQIKLHLYRDDETCFVDSVSLMGSEQGNEPLQAISIRLRVPRSPVIGDKFSSRHGQKGVCSQKWPTIDMPFSESGIVPDVIINPHAFPSRMTIGMFVESLAGKAGALHGKSQDSSPWRFSEEKTAAEYFGSQLQAAGYNYHGNEPMYSGITGKEFAADIFVGLVFYQRLRHMVNDKYQVRTTGPVSAVTGQPIKGRSRGGGIRVGEMERDALLAHGCAFLLQDRLLNCSDYRREWICKQCGNFLSMQPTVLGGAKSVRGRSHKGTGVVRCRWCARRVEEVLDRGDEVGLGDEWEDGNGGRWVGGEDTTLVVVPAALKYLDAELAALGIRIKYNVKP